MKLDPFLRWAGSKRKLISKLKPYWNNKYNRYVEPFMGSSCLFFAIQPEKALLADINLELVETFKIVRDEPEALYNRLNQIPKGKENYYILRSTSPSSLSLIDRAARFIFLNRYCFNGLYRTNKAGQFNVPYSSARAGKLPTCDELQNVSLALKNKEILQADFEMILTEHVREGDFVYLDPPYAVQNQVIFNQYGPQTFGLGDLDRLKSALFRIEEKGVSFVLSYAFCQEVEQKFSEWKMNKILIQRNISGFAKHRRFAAELIITNIPE